MLRVYLVVLIFLSLFLPMSAIHEAPKTIRTIPTMVQLPDCLIYRGKYICKAKFKLESSAGP